jgi:hypothetical protein
MHGVAVAGMAAVAAAATLLGAGRAGEPVARPRPHAAVIGCADRSEASFPRAFEDRGNIVVGPLVLVGGREPVDEASARRTGGAKYPLLVRAGHRVTVAVRDGAGLAYRHSGRRTGPAALTFAACPPGTRHDSQAGRREVTFFSGFVVVRSPRCVRLDAWPDRARTPRRATLAIGAGC